MVDRERVLAFVSGVCETVSAWHRSTTSDTMEIRAMLAMKVCWTASSS